jgi:putative transposase
MPRRQRCLLPGVACHITQRGVDRRDTFSSDADRETYLTLLLQHLPEAGVRLLGWCLMTNHVHLVALPERADSLPILLRRLQGRYAQYYNARHGRIGHLWQNRYFSCPLGAGHLWAALAYIERNPVRAGLVPHPADYPWSSATAHLTLRDPLRLIDLDWFRAEPRCPNWRDLLHSGDPVESARLRRCTFADHPFGDPTFEQQVGDAFHRHWTRGRPRLVTPASYPPADTAQLALFACA